MATNEEIEVFRMMARKTAKSRYRFRLWLFKSYHKNRYGTTKVFPYQRKYLKSEAGKKCLLTGRQVGKSVMNAVECLSTAYLNDYQTIVLLAPGLVQTKELYGKIKEMLSTSDLLYDYVVTDNQSELKFKNHSVIKIITANATSVRGFTASLVVCDEAGFIPDDVYQALDALTLVQGGSIRLITTPSIEKKGRFYEIWSDPNNDDVWEKHHVTTYDNEAITPEELEQMKARMGSESAIIREMEGRYTDEDTSTLVSPQIIRRQMRIGTKPQPDFTKYEYYMGADIAMSGSKDGDYTAISVFAVPHGLKNIDECQSLPDYMKIQQVRLVTRKTPDTYVAAQLILDEYNKWQPVRISIDSNGIGKGVYDTLNKALPNKLAVVPMNLRGTERTDAYLTVADLLTKDCIVLLNDTFWKPPKDIELPKTLDHYANITKSKNNMGKWNIIKGSSGHDDIVDSHVYAIWTIVGNIGRAPKKLSFCNDIEVSQLWMQPRGGFR